MAKKTYIVKVYVEQTELYEVEAESEEEACDAAENGCLTPFDVRESERTILDCEEDNPRNVIDTGIM